MLHRSRTLTAATPLCFTSQRRGKGQEVQVGSGIYNTDIHSAPAALVTGFPNKPLSAGAWSWLTTPLLSPQSLSPPTPSWSVEGAESPDHLGVLQTLVCPVFSGSCLWLKQFELSLALRQDGQLVLRKPSAGNSHLGSGIAHSPASLLPQLQSETQSNIVGKELGQKRLKAWLVPVASPGREHGRSPRSHFLCHR